MKTIDIIGKNYFGHFEHERTACRAVMIRDGKILVTYETKNDGQYMIPGGGIEECETEQECVVREVIEETGYVIRPSECLLKINEYYEDWKFVSLFFLGEIVGESEVHLTKQEQEVGMECRWEPLEKVMDALSHHQDYEGKDEMRRGMYYREYTALTNILGEKNGLPEGQL